VPSPSAKPADLLWYVGRFTTRKSIRKLVQFRREFRWLIEEHDLIPYIGRFIDNAEMVEECFALFDARDGFSLIVVM